MDAYPVRRRVPTRHRPHGRHLVLTDADVLVVGDRVAEVGTGLTAPEGALEVDATGGSSCPA